MPVSGSTHGEAQPTCRPFRRTGLAASAVTDALAERHGTSQTWQLAERHSRQIADLLCLTPAAGSRSFRARPPSATSCFSRRRSREICTGLLLSAFQSQDVGYRGAMVKEKPSVLPGLLFGLGFADSSTASCCTRS